MVDQLHALRDAALADIAAAPDAAALGALRIKYLGRQGALATLSDGMKTLTKEERPAAGKALNETRNALTAALESRDAALTAQGESAALAGVDLTLPGTPTVPLGSLHPMTQLLDRTVQIFRRLGFALADGPDIDDEFHCFDALNTPADHPARNEQDTFYLPDGRLLRTHTSTVQIRTMETQGPPVRIIAPGAAYRRDETDATHLAQFNQVEGLCVDAGVSLADLKGTVEFFLKELFGLQTKVRFRPHFFPFTEPSFEVDLQSPALGGKWLELAGCGMVDPAVFAAVNQSRGDDAYDPEKISGYAFGFGLDRLAMLMADLPDIRLLIENDVRFLAQFAG
ncbi:MAG: phenylalanine--tRNA ligase subunit alpha [Verrucomicrobia bacterium]|nr:phenylalanine--tRNA ligase subunit alpha [Verrucomicrobiota bacterium]